MRNIDFIIAGIDTGENLIDNTGFTRKGNNAIYLLLYRISLRRSFSQYRKI